MWRCPRSFAERRLLRTTYIIVGSDGRFGSVAAQNLHMLVPFGRVAGRAVQVGRMAASRFQNRNIFLSTEEEATHLRHWSRTISNTL